MLALAHKRIADRPDKYVDHVYGEKELGGTSVLYLSAVPFEKLGFPTYGEKPFPAFTQAALGAVPPAVMAWAPCSAPRTPSSGSGFSGGGRVGCVGIPGPRPRRIRASQDKLLTPFNWVLLLLMAFGAVSFVARFALGLGGSTNLSDTYPWGLWILFDLVWIAVAAGAFAMAGVIYVFQRKDLYGLGRTAVLMGLLSYSFVMVTLVADLGLPWHSYQLALQAPEHSAMFEVSWCVGLYVTILLLEFLPVPFEHWGFHRAAAALRRWNGAYVAAAVTLFVYLLSRNLLYALATAVIFGTLAWVFRARDQKAEPIMLAIAAVTLSTMHQSSLGSLYLLMPNMLAPQWWSPVMPVSFFLSSIAAGTALVILIDMWIAKGGAARSRSRGSPRSDRSRSGRSSSTSCSASATWRSATSSPEPSPAGSAWPSRPRSSSAACCRSSCWPASRFGSAPTCSSSRRSSRSLGVAFNRMNVVLFAMTFRGRMPWVAPESYVPSIVEWGVSIGLIAATIFLFGLAARLMPVLQGAAQRGTLSR